MLIRPLNLDDVSACLSLATRRDWAADEVRWRLLLEVGRGFGVETPEGGLVGTVIATPFEQRAAWIGMMLVAPTHQRRGLGERLMEHVLGQFGPLPTLLYSTEMGRPLYEKLGFIQVEEIMKYMGRLEALPPLPLVPGVRVRPMTGADLDAVVALDTQASGMPRRLLLQALLRLASQAHVAEQAGQVVGYGMAWPNLGATVVGPLIAKEESIARSLAAGLLRGCEGPVRMDIPTRFTELSTWAVELGLVRQAPSPMMLLHGTRAPGRREQLFAVAAQAVG
jgi:ribosomal protein S18 acetylase RimI-like enzyme